MVEIYGQGALEIVSNVLENLWKLRKYSKNLLTSNAPHQGIYYRMRCLQCSYPKDAQLLSYCWTMMSDRCTI